MKKLGLLATLAMCVTIGGVYATWNYLDPSLEVTQQAVVGLTGSGTTEGEALKIQDGSNSLAFKIDDSDGDHNADTIVQSGSITVVYDVAPTNKGAATIYCNVTIVHTGTDGKEYLKTTLGKNALSKEFDLNGADVEWTVTAAELGIDFGADGKFSLPTKEEYTAFAASFGSQVTINVHFSLSPIA